MVDNVVLIPGPELKKLDTRATKRWRLVFLTSVISGPVTLIISFIPPYRALNVIDAALAGLLIANALNMLVNIKKDEAFNKLVDYLNALRRLINRMTIPLCDAPVSFEPPEERTMH